MSPISSILRSKAAAGNSSATAALLAAFSGGLLTTALVRKTSLQQQNNKSNENERSNFQIETDLMERIAQKPYLQAFTSNEQHPKGVPHRLRILAIDVPEMRTAFDGECRINLSKIYADDIAPAKALPKYENGGDATTTTSSKQQKKKRTKMAASVAQKSMAKSLIKCRKQKKIGVELLEASVADLNPHNMRKTHQFGNLVSYDPGKYATRPVAAAATKNHASNEEEKEEEENTPTTATTGGTSIRKDSEEGPVLATADDEVDAPWNQYAWIEELQLRVSFRSRLFSTFAILLLFVRCVQVSNIAVFIFSRLTERFLLEALFRLHPP
jgi:hypothetical protein